MPEAIQKISRESITSIIYNDLKKRIITDAEFVPGDKLPSENALAEMFGVSRNSVRSALQKLQDQGLVDIKVGSGTFVKEVTFSTPFLVSDLLESDKSLDSHLDEFRSDIEKNCARYALKRATDDELEHLYVLSQVLYEAAQRNDVEAFIKADYDFHYHLCVCSHNKLYQMAYTWIKQLLLKSMKEHILQFTENDIKRMQVSANNHIRFSEALKVRNEAKAVGLLSVIIISPVLRKPLDEQMQ